MPAPFLLRDRTSFNSLVSKHQLGRPDKVMFDLGVGTSNAPKWTRATTGWYVALGLFAQ